MWTFGPVSKRAIPQHLSGSIKDVIFTDVRPLMQLLRQPHFSFYKAYVQRESAQVVLLNPKVGSTAFREVLVAAMQQQNIGPKRSRYWPMNTARRYMTSPLKDYVHAFAYPEQYEFHCFVRNPYARVLSAWNDKLVKGFYAREYPRSMRKLVPQLRLFAQAHGLQGADDSAPLPFPTFLSFIEQQTAGCRNQHWDTQTSVLCAEFVHFTHIHPIETHFTSGVSQILEPLGVSAQWVHEQLVRPVNASGKLDKKVLDQALADRIYAVYHEDFERFGYARGSWQSL